MYIPQTPPIWQTILSFQLNPTDTTATIASELLINGNALGGLLCVSIDIGQPNPEYAIGTLSGNVITFITRNCDPLNPNNTIGTFGSIHGAGAVVKITDFASIQMMVNLFNGVTGLQNIISYASPLTPVNPQDIVDKAYVDAGLLAGAPDASTTTKGLSRLSASPNVTLGNPTITIANPAVITLSAHGLTVNDEVQFTTTGALPSPITAGVTYYVISSGLTTNAFEISLTAGGAAISTLGGTQSGTHTLIKTTPVSVGVNDTRLPTSGEVLALVGNNTDIPVGSGNKYMTQTGFQKGSEIFGITSTGNDTYVVALVPAPVSYDNGRHYFVKLDVGNTGPATINFNGLGAIPIVTGISTALNTGDMIAGGIYELIYNSTGSVFQLVNPASTVLGGIIYNNGTTSYVASTASGVQNIPHGLGKIPKYVRIKAGQSISTTSVGVPVTAETVYNGTTQSSLSFYPSASNILNATQTFSLNLSQAGAGANHADGVITFDATNIIITWTLNGSATGSFLMFWEAQG